MSRILPIYVGTYVRQLAAVIHQKPSFFALVAMECCSNLDKQTSKHRFLFRHCVWSVLVVKSTVHTKDSSFQVICRCTSADCAL